MQTSKFLFPLAALAFMSVGCGPNKLAGPAAQEGPAALRAELQRTVSGVAGADGGASASGEIGPGSSYFLFVPEAWNGELVLYVHGYTAPPFPLGPPPTEPVDALRDQILARGFAFGYSTFSENGYALQDAVQAHRDLESRKTTGSSIFVIGNAG